MICESQELDTPGEGPAARASRRAGAAILFADADVRGRQVAARHLRGLGLEVEEVSDGAELLERFEPRRHAVVLLDLRGQELSALRALKERGPGASILVVSGRAPTERIVQLMRAGAWGFLEKPFRRSRLEAEVRAALTAAVLWSERPERRHLSIEARSPDMARLLQRAERAAARQSPILILGEAGAGRERLARWIHARSPRAERPLAAVYCPAVGGALDPCPFREALADAGDGALLLVGIDALSPLACARLLRALRENRRARLIATSAPAAPPSPAAHPPDPADEALPAELRAQLSGVSLRVPPLRERPEDIEPLATRFLGELAPGWPPLSAELLRALVSRRWPGNVRELRNALEHAIAANPSGPIQIEDLPPETSETPEWLRRLPPGLSLPEIEESVVRWTLARCGGNLSQAARELGVPRHILSYRLQKYQIDRRGEPT